MHFTLIKELHYTIEELWFSACDCGFDNSWFHQKFCVRN